MSKHTKEPFRTGKPGRDGLFPIYAADGLRVGSAIFLADAILLASAPELLASLRSIVNAMDAPDATSAVANLLMDAWLEEARAAIAKAEGDAS